MEDDLVQYIRNNAYLMKKSYEENGASNAVFHYSSKMLQILRHEYEPRKYYEAYTQVVQELSHLSLDLMDCTEEEISSLYDRVQLEPFTVPRMYLLILIGSIAIRKKVDSVLNIVQDIHEMCRCVQHPIRGMFVRYYLITTLKTMIPNRREDYDDSNDFDELVHFVLQNFTEMNKLWVRMQYLAALEDRKRVETERFELKILIASNMVKLCEMCNDDSTFYEESVLKVIMNDIIVSNDPLAEEFLFECILNIFPESFHANKLSVMVEMLSTLDKKLDFGRCFNLLCNRIQLRISHLKSENKIEEGGQILSNLLKSMEIFDIKGEEKITMSTRLIFYTALLTSVVKTFPDRLDYLDELLGQIVKGVKHDVVSSSINDGLHRLLISVINNSKDINIILSIPNFLPLFDIVKEKTSLSCHIVDKAFEQNISFYDASTVEKISIVVRPILVEEFDNDDITSAEEAWGHACQMMRLIKINDPLEKLNIFKKIKNILFQNVHSRVLRIVLPTLFVEVIKLMDTITVTYSSNPSNYNNYMKELSQFIFNCSKLLNVPDDSDLAIYLFIMCSVRMDKYKFESKSEVMYEFLSKVFTYYEEDILDNNSQLTILQAIITEISKLKNLSSDNRNCFYQRCVHLSLKLLKKRDQCIVTLQATRLYYVVDDKDMQKKIKNLLMRLEKIASQCMDDDVRVECFIDILENYIYYYSLSCPDISIEYIRVLYEKVKTDVQAGSSDIKSEKSLLNYFGNVCSFIQRSHPVIWDSLTSQNTQ